MARRSGEQMLLAASRSRSAVASTRGWLRWRRLLSLRIMLLHYGPLASLQPPLLGSTTQVPLEATLVPLRPLAGDAAARLCAFFNPEDIIGLVILLHDAPTFGSFFGAAWSFPT